MADLVLLRLDNEQAIRCVDLNEAKKKAISHSKSHGQIRIEVTLEGGGPINELKFDRISGEWISV